MAGLAESLFPRSSRLGHLSGYHPRALLGAVLDVASLPGRAYASLGRMEDESYLDALGRTVPRYVVSAGRPVSTFQGLGSLLSSPSDTYYTRGGR